MLSQPRLHGRVVVRGVVVAHHVQLYSGVGFGDQLEEREELPVAMTGQAGIRGDATGGGLQCREQDGRTVSHIVVSTPFGPAEPDR